MLVMDFDSDDGTQDFLRDSQWSDFVRVVPFGGIANLDSSNIILSLAKKEYGPDNLCVFCDPDEFLVIPSMTLCEHRWADRVADTGRFVVPRFNVTAERAAALSDQARLTPFDSLELRIDRRFKNPGAAGIGVDSLGHPWIFSAIPGKVVVQVGLAESIGNGDHSARCTGGRKSDPEAGTYYLHYPFRTFAEFKKKIELARIDFGANQHLPANYGWQLRRWIRLADERKLHEEYLDQFIPDFKLNSLLTDGTLHRDRSVSAFHQSVL